MPNYIEIDKNSLFPSASTSDRIVVGVNTSDKLVTTDSNGVTSVVGESWAPYTSSYNVYTAKLTQDGGLEPPSASFTEENTLGFTPSWVKLTSGQYYFNFSQSVDPDKIIPFIYPNSIDNILSTFIIDDPSNYSFFDNTFTNNNWNNQVRAIATQADGKIIIGGAFTSIGFGLNYLRIARLDVNGDADNTFISPDGGFNGRVRKIAVQPDGKVLVAGDFTSYYDASTDTTTNCSGIARLTDSGSFDNDFTIGTGFHVSAGSEIVGGGLVYEVVVQPDGKILVGGWFDGYDGTTSNRIIRLDASGSIDATFNIGDGFSRLNGGTNYDRVSTIALQSDGKIICGGMFDTYTKGTTYNCSKIIKLDASGSVDTTFYNNIGSGFNNENYVNAVRLQTDGKIVVGGYLTDYYGDTVSKLTRLNSNGTLDIDFNAVIVNDNYFGGGQVNDVKILTSGHMVVVGNWGNGYIRRINAKGYSVTTYNDGFNSICYVLEPQPYGKILVGGDFTQFFINGETAVSVNKLARLYSSFDVVLTSRAIDGIGDGFLTDTPIEIRQYI